MSSDVQTEIVAPRDEFIERGQRVYDARLRKLLEAEHTGRYVAIEPETGRHFLGDTGVEALLAARAAIPECLFYLVRIGHRAAHTIGGHASRIR